MLSTRMRKAAVAAVVVAAVAVASPAMASKQVAATIDGDKILKSDVMETLKEISISGDDAKKVYPVVVNQMVNDKLLDKAIKDSKLEKSKAFQTRLAKMKEQLLRSMFIKNKVDSKVKDSDVKAEYNKIKKENQGKKEAHARHILVKTEAEAKQVVKDLQAGKKFTELAKQRSSDPSAQNGGDLGFFAEGEVVPEFSKAAFGLKPGKFTTEPVKTQFGYHVIYLEKFRDRKVPGFEEVEKNIRAGLSQKAVDELVTELRKDAKVELYDYDGKPVKQAASEAKK